MKRNTFVFYTEWIETIDLLPEDEQTQLIKDIVRFVEGEAPVFLPTASGAFRVAYNVITKQIKRDQDKFEEACEKKREGINRRWQALKAARESGTFE